MLRHDGMMACAVRELTDTVLFNVTSYDSFLETIRSQAHIHSLTQNISIFKQYNKMNMLETDKDDQLQK